LALEIKSIAKQAFAQPIEFLGLVGVYKEIKGKPNNTFRHLTKQMKFVTFLVLTL